jgi:hypothetical protein
MEKAQTLQAIKEKNPNETISQQTITSKTTAKEV